MDEGEWIEPTDGWYSDEFFQELERADIAFDVAWSLRRIRERGVDSYEFEGVSSLHPRVFNHATTMYAAVNGAMKEADRWEA